MKTVFRLAVVFPFLILVFAIPVGALDLGDAGGEEILSDLEAIIPDSIKELLPPDLIGMLEEEEKADPLILADTIDGGYLTTMLRGAWAELWKPFLQAFTSCVAMTVAAAIFHSFKPLSGESAGGMDWLVSLTVVLTLFQIGQDGLSRMKEALTSVSVFMRALMPTVAVLYAAGGNTVSGAAEEGILLLILELIETFSTQILTPMLHIAVAFCAVNQVAGEKKLNGICATISKSTVLILSLLMTVFSITLSHQHIIAEKADSMMLRSLRFAASGIIPIVGGSVSEIMGTTAGAVGMLRASVGTVVTAVVLAILLIPGMQLLGIRIALRLSGLISHALGVPAVASVTEEIGSVFDLALAILAVCFLSLLFAMTLMIRCAVAVA